MWRRGVVVGVAVVSVAGVNGDRDALYSHRRNHVTSVAVPRPSTQPRSPVAAGRLARHGPSLCCGRRRSSTRIYRRPATSISSHQPHRPVTRRHPSRASSHASPSSTLVVSASLLITRKRHFMAVQHNYTQLFASVTHAYLVSTLNYVAFLLWRSITKCTPSACSSVHLSVCPRFDSDVKWKSPKLSGRLTVSRSQSQNVKVTRHRADGNTRNSASIRRNLYR